MSATVPMHGSALVTADSGSALCTVCGGWIEDNAWNDRGGGFWRRWACSRCAHVSMTLLSWAEGRAVQELHTFDELIDRLRAVTRGAA